MKLRSEMATKAELVPVGWIFKWAVFFYFGINRIFPQKSSFFYHDEWGALFHSFPTPSIDRGPCFFLVCSSILCDKQRGVKCDVLFGRLIRSKCAAGVPSHCSFHEKQTPAKECLIQLAHLHSRTTVAKLCTTRLASD